MHPNYKRKICHLCMDDKKPNFLFSTPLKSRQIQIFKRKQEEVKEDDDVYNQLSKILDEEVSSSGLKEEKDFLGSDLSNKENHTFEISNSEDIVSQTEVDHNKGKKQNSGMGTIKERNYRSEIEHKIENKKTAEENCQERQNDLSGEFFREDKKCLDKENFMEGMSVLEVCNILTEKILNERYTNQKLQEDIGLLRNELGAKEVEYRDCCKTVESLSKTNCELVSSSTLLKDKLNCLEEMFSVHKEYIGDILQTINKTTSSSVSMNNQLIKENHSLKSNINAIDLILSGLQNDFEYESISKEELDSLINGYEVLESKRSRMNYKEVFDTTRDIFETALEVVSSTVEIIEVGEEMGVISKKEMNLKARCLEDMYTDLIRSMEKEIEGVESMLIDQKFNTENVYCRFKTEIRRLKNKLRQLKKKSKKRKRVKRRETSDVDIWDVFK